MSNLEPKSGG